jgi:Trm5-related predicted tRNA methylase
MRFLGIWSLAATLTIQQGYDSFTQQAKVATAGALRAKPRPILQARPLWVELRTVDDKAVCGQERTDGRMIEFRGRKFVAARLAKVRTCTAGYTRRLLRRAKTRQRLPAHGGKAVPPTT